MARIAFVAVVAAATSWLLPACATVSAHENFVNIMNGNVGRSTTDPYVYPNRNRNLSVASRRLSNGNLEEEFRGGRGPTCRVFFEINEKAEKIVGWRYEGTNDDCGIVP